MSKHSTSAPIMSMTGFARADGAYEGYSWAWEVRAVNGKNLDIRLRLPAGFEALEATIRMQVAIKLTRGNLQITLTLQGGGADGQFIINHALLGALVKAGADMVESGAVAPARLDGLYQVRGVLIEDQDTASSPKHAGRNAAIMESLGGMTTALLEARMQEGAALAEIFTGIVARFEHLIAAAKNSAGAQAGQIKSQFEAKMTALIGEALDPEKLAHEAALLALKADVREELDRLDAHIDQAKSLLALGSPIGRKLDFLSQEFIREINTLCSKSTSIELTNTGLEMKSLIEQFREQAANAE